MEMSDTTMSTIEHNLVLRAGVRIQVSITQPTGMGATDPTILFNETAHRLNGQPLSCFNVNRTYDTFDGPGQAYGPDWYIIEFAEQETFNCIEMTMGIAHPDGGWWTSLEVEVRSQIGGDWHRVESMQITPPYNFSDTAFKRYPFESYLLTFAEVTAQAVRLIGRAGGDAQFTSLARLAVYRRNLTQRHLARLHTTPVPRIFQLIAPRVIWDLSFHLVKATDIGLTIPLLYYYLNSEHSQNYLENIRRVYQGETQLWKVIGSVISWRALDSLYWGGWVFPEPKAYASISRPSVRLSWFETMAQAVAPVVVNGQVLGELITRPVLLKGRLDEGQHHCYALEYGIPWQEYRTALRSGRQWTLEQMEGLAALIGLIANQIANHAHCLDLTSKGYQPQEQRRAEIVRRAIHFMEQHLTSPISVKDVAHTLQLTPSYFSLLFTEETGQNPSDMLITMRIERVKEYLTYTTMPVQGVCRALGYDSSYLMRLFKRRTGYTLGEYARKVRKSSHSEPE
jgi:AraC-like DNA-binding protein